MEPLDRTWLQQHPLPALAGGDKNSRGRVLVVGGAEFVPGALRLTGEAALRAGAGKLGLATVETAAISLGVNVPEASMLKLPADDEGRIAASAAEKIAGRMKLCDTMVFGPGMPGAEQTEKLVEAVLRAAPAEITIVLDAGALTACANLGEAIAARSGRTILTPHRGEMCRLTGLSEDQIESDPGKAARDAAARFGAVIVLKGERTVLAAPRGECARFTGGTPGLATSGSGDVLAGLIGGFAARGASPLAAAGWGVFVHGTAGERASAEIGEIGFLARELLPRVPAIVAELGGTISL